MRVILASGSPRRKELLSSIIKDFEVIPSNSEERECTPLPDKMVMSLAEQKAMDIAIPIYEGFKDGDDDFLVIGSDTIVATGKDILGKPADEKECREMMEKLSGKTHEVYTGVHFCWTKNGEMLGHSFFECTKVSFYEMTPDEIDAYVKNDKDQWFDKAGAYGIQTTFGQKYVKGIEGNYDTVVGFPTSSVYQKLKALELL